MKCRPLFRCVHRIAPCLILPLLLASTARASLLIYEGFNYTAGSNLSAITPNASTLGLNQTTAYAGTGVGNYAVQSTSLSFGSLQTTGGSVSFSTATNVASGKLALASAYSGTLWSSYLVTLSTQGGLTADGALIRIADNTGNMNERFLSLADSRSSTTTVAIGYDATPSTTLVTLTQGTTYIIISKFTNVGTALNSTTTTGESSIWALTEAQFGNFIAGGGTEAYLNAATVAGTATGVTARTSDTTLTTGSYSLATGSFAAFVSVGDAGSFDEMRFGTTLADVTPIPEPAVAGAMAGGVATLLAVLRRRRRATARR